jgi:hypothetical protein
MKFNYIPLADVLARVYTVFPQERTTVKKLYEWASDAVRNVMVFETLADGTCFARVENHKAILPKNWKILKQILFNDCSVNEDTNLEVHLVGINLIEGSSAYVEGNQLLIDPNEPSDDVVTIPVMGSPDGTYIEGTKLTFNKSERYLQNHKGWKPLRESTSNFHQAINCGVDLSAECGKETYSYDKGCNSITTSFQKGWVCISFKYYPECNETFMIPDRESYVPQAIEKYILWKLFEREANIGVQNAERREAKYQREWGLESNKAKSEQKMMDIDELENLKNAMMRLTQHNYSYDSGFGNASDVDNVKFDEIPFKR